YQSEADEDASAREKEETKRLLYVALTRARDRLYLATLLRDGAFKPGRGSLGEVIPSDFQRAIEDAHAHTRQGGRITWPGASRPHELYVCRTQNVVIDTTVRNGVVAVDRSLPAGLAPLASGSTVTRLNVIEVARGRAEKISEAPSRAAGADVDDSDVLVGRLVHRLLRFGVSPAEDASVLGERARSLIEPDERLSTTDVEQIVETAVNLARDIGKRDEVVRALAAGDVHAEVPFALRVGVDNSTWSTNTELLAGSQNPNGWILRGTIDCLIVGVDEVSVIEFKTGRSRAADRRQLELYVRAAEAMFPKHRVQGLLVYP
ncbi:MAG: PD-(D/E)XK nuclease family protein, partial [Vicinamibacteraceae bacterium]